MNIVKMNKPKRMGDVPNKGSYDHRYNITKITFEMTDSEIKGFTDFNKVSPLFNMEENDFEVISGKDDWRLNKSSKEVGVSQSIKNLILVNEKKVVDDYEYFIVRKNKKVITKV